MRWLLVGILALFWTNADAQVSSTAQNPSDVSQFNNPNLMMPNGAYLAHMIYTAASSATMNSTSDATCYGSTGVGNQTPLAAAFYVGAKFRLLCGGTYSVGITVATLLIKVKVGSTTIASFTTPSLPTSVTGLSFLVSETCTVRVAGASGSMVCTGGVSYTTSTLGIAAIFNPLVSSSPVSVDLSTAQKFDVTAAFSTVAGSPSAISLESSIEQID